jgi:SAM-dependent methyltransferase
MESFWNDRYGASEYAYGEEPNEYFALHLSRINLSGTILLAAEGEGRNAVFAAQRGWAVRAFDLSEEGQRKARQLAEKVGVSIDYQISSADDYAITPHSVDALGLIYAHFPAAVKNALNQRLSEAVKPGGYVIFEAFSKQQLGHPSGGPKDVAMLFSLDEVVNAFRDFEVIELAEEQIGLREGLYHNGPGSVIRFVGRKKQTL